MNTDPKVTRPRLVAVNRRQMVMRAMDVERLIEEDHPARSIWELVGRLDLSRYYAEIAAVEGRAGRDHTDPQVLISLGLYAYSRGISSAREVARRCEYEPAFQWLCALDLIRHRTLSGFRSGHQAALNHLFVQVLGMLCAEGLITLERVTLDGTKIKANAGGNTFRRRETLDRCEQTLGRRPRQIVAGGDYTNHASVEAAANCGVDFYGSWQESWKPGERDAQGRRAAFLASAFPYQTEPDGFTCPAGKSLTHRAIQNREHGVRIHVYGALREACRECALRSQCAPPKARPAWVRSISRLEEPAATVAFKAKMATEQARQIYGQRSRLAEFPTPGLERFRFECLQFRYR